MLAASFASGAALDGNDNDRVDDRFGFFRGAHSRFVVNLADRIAAVRDQHDDFPSLAAVQSARGKINRIIEGGGGADADVLNAIVNAFQVGSISASRLVHDF